MVSLPAAWVAQGCVHTGRAFGVSAQHGLARKISPVFGCGDAVFVHLLQVDEVVPAQMS